MQRHTHSRRRANRKKRWFLSTSALALVIIASGSVAFGSTVLYARNSQLAAAVETTSKDCDAAKQLAVKGITSGSQSGTGSEIDDKCLTAFFDQSKVQPNEQNPRQNPKNYRCDFGKSVTVSIDSKGKITETWRASANVPKGTCSTQYCDASGCHPTKQMSGISGSQLGGLEQLPQTQTQQMPPIPQANGIEQLPQQNNPISPDSNYHDLGTQYPSQPTPQTPQNNSWWDGIKQYLGFQSANTGVEQGSGYAQPSSDSYPGTVVPPIYQNFESGQNISQLQPGNELNQSITPPSENPLRNYYDYYPQSNSTFQAQDSLQTTDQGSQSGQPLNDKFQNSVVPSSYQGQQFGQPLQTFVNSGNLYQGSQSGQPIGWSAWMYRLLGTFWPR